MFDLLIAGGTIYDGLGGAPFQADLAVRGDRIAAVGRLDRCEAKETVDASGMAVTPGFIDVHTHSDWQFFLAPDRAEALCQGITTEIAGACGIGLFPLLHSDYGQVMTGIFGAEPQLFGSCAEYLASLPPTGVNAAVHLAHSPLRCALCGFRDAPLPVQKAQDLARQAFEEGACAFSTGLAYYPASFGDTEEVAAICRVAAEFDVPVCVHQRTALRDHTEKFDSREEVLEFARRSGARVHFSHYRTNPKTAGHLDELLEPIERGLEEGLRVTADFYPYSVGAGYTAVHLPMRVMEGGFSSIMERVRNPEWKQWIQKEWERHPEISPSNAVLLHAPRHPDYRNRTYRDIARMRGQEIPEMLLELLAEEELQLSYRPETRESEEGLSDTLERDFIELMRHPCYLFGSDTLPGLDHLHPRSFGAFARLLHLAFRHGVTLSEFVLHASARPCELFGLHGRGVIAEQNFADLCVFHHAEIADRATFAHPRRTAEGMRLVTVNGQIAVRNGKPTGIRAGRPLRRGQ